jgi:hypothetical protein
MYMQTSQSNPGSETQRLHVFSHIWKIATNTNASITIYIYIYIKHISNNGAVRGG